MAKRARRTTSGKRRDRITRLESELAALREAKAFMTSRLNTLRVELAILKARSQRRGKKRTPATPSAAPQ